MFRSPLRLCEHLVVFAVDTTNDKNSGRDVVRLSLMESLNSGTNSDDDPVRFEVTEDVKAGEVAAIPKGAPPQREKGTTRLKQ